jgi:hypothetical protein
LRYRYAPPITAACAALFVGVAGAQWLDPFNHQPSGNLLLLSYLPGLLGVFTLSFTVYSFTYRATLQDDLVRVRRWLLNDIHLRIESITSIEERDNCFVVIASGKGTYTYYKMLSGHQGFFRELRARSERLR